MGGEINGIKIGQPKGKIPVILALIGKLRDNFR
jgi:hypothetical protein